jgi:hypothetical protein
VAKEGFAFQPELGGPAVQACHGERLKDEFYGRCPANGTATQQRQKRWKAFNNAYANLIERGAIGARLINDQYLIWIK